MWTRATAGPPGWCARAMWRGGIAEGRELRPGPCNQDPYIFAGYLRWDGALRWSWPAARAAGPTRRPGSWVPSPTAARPGEPNPCDPPGASRTGPSGVWGLWRAIRACLTGGLIPARIRRPSGASGRDDRGSRPPKDRCGDALAARLFQRPRGPGRWPSAPRTPGPNPTPRPPRRSPPAAPSTLEPHAERYR